ncbi:DUF2663 family protein [Alteribacter aurantiacus]|uniref:DUF2663 family protein n=1 Tax=Alteribacter aurantiacus TaxID=254410 RepID=UPI000409C60A|nr:DUF2663 family protein [Alteribacter aurantiacus]
MNSNEGFNKNEDNLIVNALVKAKQKEKVAEKKVVRAGLICLCMIILTVLYVTLAVFFTHHSSQYWSVMIHDPILLILIGVLVYTFAYLKKKKSAQEKADKDFKKLREDIIDRSMDVWQTQGVTNDRNVYYDYLLKNHNINLYHK